MESVDVWDNPLMSPRRLILVAATSTQRYSDILKSQDANWIQHDRRFIISHHLNKIDTEFHAVLACLRILFSSASLDFNLFALVSRSE